MSKKPYVHLECEAAMITHTIDLSAYTHLGTSTPGPPATPGDYVGTASHWLNRHGLDLIRSGDRLHLWHGDWLSVPYEIYQYRSSQHYLAIGQGVKR